MRIVTASTVAGTATLCLLVANALPTVTFWPPLRQKLLPGLAGVGRSGHVALTFDDGPNPESTPFFLRELDRHGTRATFFLLGSELVKHPDLVHEMVAAGHEIALHGWDHRRMVWYGWRRTYDEMARGRDLIAETTGQAPTWFRPPYGVLTSAALVAARRLDLRPVLWTCWGWDWSRKSTSDSVVATVTRGLASGGTVLLHDSDVAAAPGAWRSTLGALPRLLTECADRGWVVGPLVDHGLCEARGARLSY